MKSKTTTILITLVALIAVFFLYRFFFVSDDLDSFTVEEAGGEAGEIVLVLSKLKSIKLDISVLSSPAIQGLVDYGVMLEPQPVGRLNPFAPVGQDALPEPEPVSVEEADVSEELPAEEGDESQE